MIVTCGEALVDLVPERVNGEMLYRPVPGGSHYNVALGIARLGGRAGYLWELSTDGLGDMLRRHLADAGVDTSAVLLRPRATPVAVVDLSGPEARYNIADPDRVMLDTPLATIPADAECLLIGSAVLARGAVAETIEGVALAAVAAGSVVLAIDYNVRPPSIVDLEAYRNRLVRLSRRAAVVKASVADLELLGIERSEDFMVDLVANGTALAVLTAAEDGAFAFHRLGLIAAPTRARTVVDTVGAGDAFMAGLLAALQQRGMLDASRLAGLTERDVSEVLDMALRAAAFTCATRGAVMPAAADLDMSLVSG